MQLGFVCVCSFVGGGGLGNSNTLHLSKSEEMFPWANLHCRDENVS